MFYCHDTLSPGMSADVDAKFAVLQRKLVPLWQSIQVLNQDPQTIVVVPSLTVDIELPAVLTQAYEERYLFLLLLLRQPRARLIYVTSQQIHPDIVDYYLDLLPGVISSHARRRLFLVSPLDGSSQPLTSKLLARPHLLDQIRSLIVDKDRAHLVPFTTTELERDLALKLEIPVYGSDPKFLDFGTKSGARRIFAEEGVPHPSGLEDLESADDLVDAIVEIRRRRPGVESVIVKLNEGVSGGGNATVDLSRLGSEQGAAERAGIIARLQTMRFELDDLTYESYMAKLAAGGGIVEERLKGTDFRSPSAQMRVTPLGEVELLSTHDQLLGGPTGQSYLGCRFPADREYGPAIMREAAKVGRRLGKEGVLGRFALDFVAFRNDQGGWEVSAIEINLRKGGTTHPFLTLQFLTDGWYDAETGVYTTLRGESKYYVATDHLQSPAYRVFTHEDLFDLVMCHGLHFDETRQTGIVLHMLNALAEEGLVGLTAIGNSPEEAERLYGRMAEVLDKEATLWRDRVQSDKR